MEILTGEVGLDGYRAHVHERTIELIDAVHEHDVLVDLLFGDFDKSLADGFDITDPWVVVLQGGNEAEGNGRLALILARSRDEHARGGGVQNLFNRSEMAQLFARQLFASPRIQQVIINRLDADDSSDTKDVMSVGTTGNVRGGPVQPK